MFIIVLNQNNLIQDGGNNKLVYKFPNSINLTDKYVTVSSISMFYSWNNIDAIYANNTLTYTWNDGSGAEQLYTITIPDGIYEIADLNSYFQFVMIQNLTYWINSSGQYVYPWEMIVNASRYAVQINTYLVPTAVQAAALGYTLPAGQTWPPDNRNITLTILGNFNNIIGYNAGFQTNVNVDNLYVPPTPSASTNYESKNSAGTLSYLSNTAPQVQPNSNLLLNLSGINSPYAQPSGIIYSLNPSVASGEAISEKPPNFMWNKFISGTYNELRLTLLGTDLRPLKINDPNMTILLAIRDANEGFLSAK